MKSIGLPAQAKEFLDNHSEAYKPYGCIYGSIELDLDMHDCGDDTFAYEFLQEIKNNVIILGLRVKDIVYLWSPEEIAAAMKKDEKLEAIKEILVKMKELNELFLKVGMPPMPNLQTIEQLVGQMAELADA